MISGWNRFSIDKSMITSQMATCEIDCENVSVINLSSYIVSVNTSPSISQLDWMGRVMNSDIEIIQPSEAVAIRTDPGHLRSSCNILRFIAEICVPPFVIVGDPNVPATFPFILYPHSKPEWECIIRNAEDILNVVDDVEKSIITDPGDDEGHQIYTMKQTTPDYVITSGVFFKNACDPIGAIRSDRLFYPLLIDESDQKIKCVPIQLNGIDRCLFVYGDCRSMKYFERSVDRVISRQSDRSYYTHICTIHTIDDLEDNVGLLSEYSEPYDYLIIKSNPSSKITTWYPGIIPYSNHAYSLWIGVRNRSALNEILEDSELLVYSKCYRTAVPSYIPEHLCIDPTVGNYPRAVPTKDVTLKDLQNGKRMISAFS